MKKNKYYAFEKFSETGLVSHAFTDRTLNLGFNTVDADEKILDNFKMICSDLGTQIEDSVLSQQTHKTDIRVVTDADRGKGLVKKRDYSDVDGLVTDIKGIALFTFYADCVPLFFLDKKKQIVGVAHAGWRGTVGHIGQKMVDVMKQTFNSDPKDIIAGIGPSIGSCCYKVNRDVIDQFNQNFDDTTKVLKKLEIEDDKWTLDLWEANKIILQKSGILEENIDVSELCTSCNNDEFFSYRVEDGNTGRMSAVIMLKQ